MKVLLSLRFFVAIAAVVFVLTGSSAILAQSKPQKTEKPTGDGKKNERPRPLTEEEKKKLEEEKKRLEEEKNAIFIDDIE